MDRAKHLGRLFLSELAAGLPLGLLAGVAIVVALTGPGAAFAAGLVLGLTHRIGYGIASTRRSRRLRVDLKGCREREDARREKDTAEDMAYLAAEGKAERL